MRWSVAAAVTFSLTLPFALQAQTPDGETPAEESICDGLTDDGGWGLCTAYCEAMDCEAASPRASEKACAKVKARFLSLDVGPLPCEVLQCPCFDAGDVEEFVAACSEPENLVCFEGMFSSLNLQCYSDADQPLQLMGVPSPHLCGVTNHPSIPDAATLVTFEEHLACRDLLLTGCADPVAALSAND
jgi:hypothetical protein